MPVDAMHQSLLNDLRASLRDRGAGGPMWELQRLQDAAAAANRLAEAKLDIPHHLVGEACHRLVQFLWAHQDAMGVVPCVSLLQSLPLRQDALRRACSALLQYVDRVRPDELTDVVAVLLDSSLGADTALVADVWISAAAMCVRRGRYRTAAELLSLPGTAAAMPGVAASLWAPRLRLLALRLCQQRGQILAAGAASLQSGTGRPRGRLPGPLRRHKGLWDASASALRVVREGDVAPPGSVIVPDSAAAIARAPATLAEIDMVADALAAAILDATEGCCAASQAAVDAKARQGDAPVAAFRPAVSRNLAEPARAVAPQEAEMAVWEALRAELCLGRAVLQVRSSGQAQRPGPRREEGGGAPLGLGTSRAAEHESAEAGKRWTLSPAVAAVVRRLRPQLTFGAVAWHAAPPPPATGPPPEGGAAGPRASAGASASRPFGLQAALQEAGVGAPPRAMGFWNARGAALRLGRLLGWREGEDAATLLMVEALETGDDGSWEGYVTALEGVAGDAVVLETRLRQLGRRIERSSPGDPARLLWRHAASPCAVDVAVPPATGTGLGDGDPMGVSHVSGFSPLATVPPACAAAALPPRHEAAGEGSPARALSDWESLTLGEFSAEAGALRVISRVARALLANPAGPATAADRLCEGIRRLQAAELPVGEAAVTAALSAAMARGGAASAVVPLAERGMTAAVAEASFDLVQTAALAARLDARALETGGASEEEPAAGAEAAIARGFVVAEGHAVELAVAAALQRLAPLAGDGLLAGLLLSSGGHDSSARPAVAAATARAQARAAMMAGAPSTRDEADGLDAASAGVEPVFHPLSSGEGTLARPALQAVHRLMEMTHSRVSGPPPSAVSDFVWAGCVVLCRAGALVYARDNLSASAAELDAEFQRLVRHAQAGRLRSLTADGLSAAVMGLLGMGDAAGAGQVLSLANASSLRLHDGIWQAAATVSARRDAHAALLHVLHSAADSAFRPAAGEPAPLAAASLADADAVRAALRSVAEAGLYTRVGPLGWHGEAAAKRVLEPWQLLVGPAAWAAYFTKAELQALAGSADARGQAGAAARIRALLRAHPAGPAARGRDPLSDTLRPAPAPRHDRDKEDSAAILWARRYLHDGQLASDTPAAAARTSEHHHRGFWGAFEMETAIGRGTLAESVEMAAAAAMAGVQGQAKFFNTQGLLRSMQTGWLPKDTELIGGMPVAVAAETVASVTASLNAVLPYSLRAFPRPAKSDKPRAQLQAARQVLRLLCRHTSMYFGAAKPRKHASEE